MFKALKSRASTRPPVGFGTFIAMALAKERAAAADSLLLQAERMAEVVGVVKLAA